SSTRPPPASTLFPSPTLFRSQGPGGGPGDGGPDRGQLAGRPARGQAGAAARPRAGPARRSRGGGRGLAVGGLLGRPRGGRRRLQREAPAELARGVGAPGDLCRSVPNDPHSRRKSPDSAGISLAWGDG